ncbi:DMT family transporter [Sphingobium sp. CR28]|uniref:DMT family transporter n=1 Tax=Sphingobium sp. CR28 TaxID=3400272 RepID=UPI003FEEC456
MSGLARLSHHRAAPVVVACVAIMVFSVMDTVMKGLSIALGAYNAMLWRTAIGVVMTGALFLGQARRWRPARPVLLLHLARSLSAAISIVLFFWGLVRVPMAQGIALSFIAPLIGLGLAALFLKERVTRRAIGGSVLAFVGVLAILIGQPAAARGAEAFHGALAILLAAIFYALNLVLSRRQSQAAGPVEVAFFFNIIAFSFYGLAAPWFAELPSSAHIPALIVAALTSILSIMMLAWSYARAEAQVLMPVEYSAFIWAALFGWWAFGERVTPATLLGAGFIIAGCIWAARGGSPVSAPISAVDPEASA